MVAISNEKNADRKQYAYNADLWLADFVQGHSTDANNLVKRLGALEENPLADANLDLKAASIYLNARLGGQLGAAPSAEYSRRYLDGKTSAQVPFLGKLVLVSTRINSDLDQSGRLPIEYKRPAKMPILLCLCIQGMRTALF